MACCPGSSGYPDAERQFGPKIASRDLDRYRQKGPDATSRLLLAAIADQLRGGDSVLDIGAGVGVLDFELLAKDATAATLVDAAPAYLDAAGREAERRQLTDRVQRVVGEFTTLADSIAPADVVMMHRVICCYPDHASLLRAATEHARRMLALSYPRDSWLLTDLACKPFAFTRREDRRSSILCRSIPSAPTATAPQRKGWTPRRAPRAIARSRLKYVEPPTGLGHNPGHKSLSARSGVRK
jgi:magnesium-protoporphyrin O-methyltransferase